MIEFEDECGLEPDDIGTLHMVAKAKYDKVVEALAESQHALREIEKKLARATMYLMKDSPQYPDGRSKEISYFQNGMDRLVDARKIARNVTGGK